MVLRARREAVVVTDDVETRLAEDPRHLGPTVRRQVAVGKKV